MNQCYAANVMLSVEMFHNFVRICNRGTLHSRICFALAVIGDRADETLNPLVQIDKHIECDGMTQIIFKAAA